MKLKELEKIEKEAGEGRWEATEGYLAITKGSYAVHIDPLREKNAIFVATFRNHAKAFLKLAKAVKRDHLRHGILTTGTAIALKELEEIE